MTVIRQGLLIDYVPIIRLESPFLRADVAPDIGGRIVNLVEKASGYQFLWHHPHLKLEQLPVGTEYDPHFYGGIDELLPNDIPETINGIDSPDHGELWTLALRYQVVGESLELTGRLPLCGLAYEKRVSLRPDSPYIDLDYRVYNPTGASRMFLWKLHAALNIAPGDRIVCPARWARVVDAQWSRWDHLEPFPWPSIEGQRADIIPTCNDTMDFFFLYELASGQIVWQSVSGERMFEYSFDTSVFPYAWYFASYGGFDGHYTAILEPCSTMPLSVNQAAQLGQCSALAPGEAIETRVSIYAGPVREGDRHE